MTTRRTASPPVRVVSAVMAVVALLGTLGVAVPGVAAAAPSAEPDRLADLDTFVQGHGQRTSFDDVGSARPSVPQAGCRHHVDWYPDPPGDASVIDVIQYGLDERCGTLGVEVSTKDAWFLSWLGYYLVELELDRNPLNGCEGADRVVYATHDVEEGYIYYGMVVTPTCNTATWTFLEGTDLNVADGGWLRDIELAFPTAVLGHGLIPEPGYFQWRVVIAGIDEVEDRAPDVGWAEYRSPTPPVAVIESITSPSPETVSVSGWVADADMTGPLRVELRQGSLVIPVVATTPRYDVRAAYPELGDARSFSVTYDAGLHGVLLVCLRVFDEAGIGHPDVDCGTVEVQPARPVGNLEYLSVSSRVVVVGGWAGQPNGAPGTQLHVYVDGVFTAAGVVDAERPDVRSLHPSVALVSGFEIVVPAEPGNRLVCVHALSWTPLRPSTLLGCHQMSIPPTDLVGELESADLADRTVGLTGWAGDRNAFGGDVDVDVLVDGVVTQRTMADLPRPDVVALEPQLGGTTGFEASVELLPGEHSVCAEAVSPFGGPRLSLGCGEAGIPATSFVAVTPVRLVDTRSGVGVLAGMPQSASTLAFDPAGAAGVPAGAIVAVEVTAVGATSPGFVTVYPCSAERPVAASLNFGPGRNTSNLAIVDSAAGGVCVHTSTQVHLVVDLQGWWPPELEVQPVTPGRLLDTRDGTGGLPLGRPAAGSVLQIDVAGRGDVPAVGVAAVALNVAVTGGTGSGYAVVYDCDGERPTASSLNHPPAQTTANLVFTPVAADGTVCIFVSASTHVIADVQAWWPDGSAYHPIAPARVLDTRDGGSPVAPGQTVVVDVAGHGGVPAEGAGAVAFNLAIAAPSAPGFVVVHPCDVPRPPTANVTFVPGRNVAAVAVARLAADGTVCVYVHGSAHVVMDLQGWWPPA